ncbi:MAG: anaerobic glycerol-3-phosphate dehydrogenase subunit C [Muribaculaceae bacterium]|nr:anaerobic glycerol-3-phosphate dehydrogenase subunit C [Muribaculaceae bacterium]
MNNSENTSPHNFEQCVKCTICTVYCPVTAVNRDYPGPKQAGPDGERYRLKDKRFYNEALKYCLNCKRCEVACPQGVHIGDIILQARLKYSHGSANLRDRMLAHTDLMGTIGTRLSPTVNGILRFTPVKFAMDYILGIDRHRIFPSYSPRRFVTWFRRHAADRQERFDRHVTYFHGCYVNYNFPRLGKDFVKVMNACGIGVNLMKNEKCCGVARIANRLIKQATDAAKINLQEIRTAVASGTDVVATSSTCIMTMRDEYPNILGLDNADVRDHIMTATRYLYRLVENGDVKLVFKSDYLRRIAYHTPCHMSRLGWSVYSTRLLSMIPGVELTILDSNCCGIAGTYGFKKENYRNSQAMGKVLFDSIALVHPDFVATDCETCKWQIEMSTPYKVFNPISVLADAIDIEATRRANNVK